MIYMSSLLWHPEGIKNNRQPESAEEQGSSLIRDRTGRSDTGQQDTAYGHKHTEMRLHITCHLMHLYDALYEYTHSLITKNIQSHLISWWKKCFTAIYAYNSNEALWQTLSWRYRNMQWQQGHINLIYLKCICHVMVIYGVYVTVHLPCQDLHVYW